MRRSFTITFEASIRYPFIEKETKQFAKDFDKWLKDWASAENSGKNIVPKLYSQDIGTEHQANGTVRVKITRDGEQILDTWWDELSNDF